MKEYLKAKLEEIETNSKIKNIRDLYSGITDFKKGYLVTDCQIILARWRNHISQLLNVHGVNDVRHTQIHKAESLMPEPSAFEVESAIEELKSNKSPGIDQIAAEVIKVRG